MERPLRNVDKYAANFARLAPKDRHDDKLEAPFAALVKASQANWRSESGIRIIVHFADHGNRDSEIRTSNRLKVEERITVNDVVGALRQKRIIYIPVSVLGRPKEHGQEAIEARDAFLRQAHRILTDRLYGSIGISGFDEDAIRERDIEVATPEKLEFALRNDPSPLDDVGLLVFDQGHMIGLNECDVRYEAQIQRLLRRADAHQQRIVCLSAILPDGDQLDDFAARLRRDHAGGLIRNDWRPTRLRIGEVVWPAARVAVYLGH